jgi:nitrate reductase NapAB chaperone NapD
MVICSYLLIAASGSAQSLAQRISALPGCDVVRAVNRDVLLVVTEAADARSQDALRDRIAAMEGVRSLSITFGEVEATPS